MPEAVIVSAARTPIGRANKGSLKDFRPDDLTALITRAALDKIPALDPNDIDDFYLGCGLPGGEAGNNMARIVTTLLGYEIPGATITRYCSSSVQTSRMAFHAIKAGEGDVFISAGVETVSRFQFGTSDHIPNTKNPLFADAQQRTEEYAQGGKDWHDPREDGQVPDIYIAMGQTAENVARLRGLDRKELDEFGVRSQNLAEKAIADGFWEREITPVTLADGTVVSKDDGPRAGVTYDAISQLDPVFRPDGVVTAGNCCALNDGAAAVVIMSDTKASRARPHPAGADRLHRRQRPLPRDHGARPGRGHQEGARQREHDDRRHRPGRDQRGVRGAGGAVVPGPRHRPGPAQHQRRRDRRRSPVRHDRGPAAEHDAELARLARQDHRPDHHVRRRRPGHGDDPRTPWADAAFPGARPRLPLDVSEPDLTSTREAWRRREPRWLDDRQQRAWRALVLGTTLLFDRLDDDLRQQHGLSLVEYEILVRLSEARTARCGWRGWPTRSPTAAAG